MFCAIVFMAVFLHKRAVFQLMKTDIKVSHSDLFSFSIVEDMAGGGFYNPVLKCLDNSDFKIMETSMG